MIKLLVIPEAVFDQYAIDGVCFNKLLSPNYIATISSINDLMEIDYAINAFPFKFCQSTGIELADSPRFGLAQLATTDSLDQFKYKDLYNRLEERIATKSLQQVQEVNRSYVYKLHPVDENIWVAVQMSVHYTDVNPNGVVVSNHNFFDSMIDELTRTVKFEQIAQSNLFTYYLESRA